jgi:hypothetical protein
VVFTAQLAALSVVRGTYTHHAGRGVAVTYAALQVWAGGRCALAIGVYDPRVGWRAPTRALEAPPYMVSTPDWEGVVARLDLGQ